VYAAGGNGSGPVVSALCMLYVCMYAAGGNGSGPVVSSLCTEN